MAITFIYIYIFLQIASPWLQSVTYSICPPHTHPHKRRAGQTITQARAGKRHARARLVNSQEKLQKKRVLYYVNYF